MKKIIAIIIVIAVASGVFILSYNYRSNRIDLQTSNVSVSAVTTMQNSENDQEENGTEGRKLVAEDKENDYQIYFDGENTEIVHGEYSRTIKSWAYSMNAETPEIHCKDYDGDGQIELMVRIVNGKLDNQYDKDASPYTYALYMFKPYTDASGEKTLSSLVASDNTWKEPFTNAIKCELTQLKSCDKFLQFTMDNADESIAYDNKTGITSNSHVGYGRALYNSNKQFYSIDRWSRGAGIYNFDSEGNIFLDIQVIVSYKDTTETQYLGDIHCQMTAEGGEFDIVPDSIVFNATDEFFVSDPRETADEKWNCVIHNESANTNFNDTVIDWIENDLSLKDTGDNNSLYFETMPTKIKCVDEIKFSESELVMTAKSGYTFSDAIAKSGKYAVTINSGEDNEYDISYSCSISRDKKSITIKFDKSYNKDAFDNVSVTFGV